MKPTFDDYDEFEFDAAMYPARRKAARRFRREKELMDELRRAPRSLNKWARDDSEDFDFDDVYDYMEFDDVDEGSSNRWS
ncbi:MAG: hypothetical protein KJO82_15320 [Gammaproteobacteria bacterium]|nr:hypothetical protein [Gammaproteobacteria bacterium]